MRMLRLSEEQFARIGKARQRAPARPSKMHNQPTTVDGIEFQSKREAVRYGALKLLQSAGEITGLERQVRFAIDVAGLHICDYVADFCYHAVDGTSVVEDVKGMRTPIYRLKRKLMKAVHAIDIVET
jgi:hypothetical protein